MIRTLEQLVDVYSKYEALPEERIRGLYKLFLEEIYIDHKDIGLLMLRFKLADMTNDMTDSFTLQEVQIIHHCNNNRKE